MEKSTPVAAPVLATKFVQAGLVGRTPKLRFRLFQTSAAPKTGFALVAADSDPLIGGGPPVPNELGMLNATLTRESALTDCELTSIRRARKAKQKSNLG